MERVIKINGAFANIEKYVLIEEIGNVGLYQHKTPNGYFVHQEWLIKRNDESRMFVVQSYNEMLYEEMLDLMDLLNVKQPLGLKAFLKDGVYFVHPNGNLEI